MSSPVFTKDKNFQEGRAGFASFNPMATAPAGDVMTLDNTLRKTTGVFAVVLVFAAVGWFFPILALPGAIIGLVLGLVNAFKKEPSPGLIFAYAAFEGLFVGGISGVLEAQFQGIVSQAVLGTLVVVGVTLLLFRSGKVRATPKLTRFFIVACSAYLVFSLINLGLMIFGVSDDPWGLRTGVEIFGIPLGLFLGAFAVLLGAYSLIMDFTFIQNGVENRIPERYGWTAAFGVTVTIIWLYVEILRMLSIARN